MPMDHANGALPGTLHKLPLIHQVNVAIVIVETALESEAAKIQRSVFWAIFASSEQLKIGGSVIASGKSYDLVSDQVDSVGE